MPSSCQFSFGLAIKRLEALMRTYLQIIDVQNRRKAYEVVGHDVPFQGGTTCETLD
jgi:hypothetical protein